MGKGPVDVAVANVKQSGPDGDCPRVVWPLAAGAGHAAPLQPAIHLMGAGIPPTTPGTHITDMALTPAQLLPATRELIQELEDLSGYPIAFWEDPDLTVLATVRLGTRQSPEHLIRYQPGATTPDYQIAVEAGHAIRMFRHPPAQRFQLASTPAPGLTLAKGLAKLHGRLPQDQRERLATFLVNGVLRQLRSCPTGLLVDYELYRRFPTLRPLQAQSFTAQLATNVKVLALDYQQRLPHIILYATRAMNAAFAMGVGELLQTPHTLVPYRAAGLERIALQLLADLPDPQGATLDDRALITAWAQRLGLGSWLHWLSLPD
jgi:hypothetical protein